MFEDAGSLAAWDKIRACFATIYLFYKVNAILQIHAKINKSPLDAFALVLLLFQYKHVMVKKLLQFLVGEVNAELFETVELWKYK